MKLKKQYIILIILVLLIISMIFVFKSKNVFISEITNKTNKFAIYNFEPHGTCDAYLNIDPETLVEGTNGVIQKEEGYLILDARETSLGYTGFVFVKEKCAWESNAFFSSINKETSCSKMKNYVTTTISNETSSDINPYLYNYWVTSYNSVCSEYEVLESKLINCSDSTKNTIISSNNVELAKKFNSVCTTQTEIPITTITMDWQGGWGPSSFTHSSWNGSHGKYTISGIAGNTVTVGFDNALKSSNQLYHLVGWSKNSSCNEFTNPEFLPEKGGAGSTHSFTFENTNVTWYACYSGSVETTSLFEGNIAKSGVEYSVMEQNECNDNYSFDNGITEVPMKTLNRYVKREFKPLASEISINASKGPSQQKYYCNVMCTDTVDVNYPNIFETVPAGQYFELMYEPEITATRTCQTEFRYSEWNNDYEDALENELTALKNLSEAQAYYNAAYNMSIDRTGRCGCCGTKCPPDSECKSTWSGTEYASYVDLNGNTKNVFISVSASSCSDESWSGEVSKIVNGDPDDENDKGLKGNLETAEEAYRNAVQHRINLEKINLQCYTALDSNKNNNEEIKYNTVIESENNTYKYKNNSLVIDDQFKYTTKTALVNLDENNYGTFNENKIVYLNYIKNDTIANVSDIAQISEDEMKLKDTFNKTNYQKNTQQFYYLEPQITFSYNDGYSLDPNLDNNEVNITETLQVEPHVKLDTGSYTNESAGIYTKDNSQNNYQSASFSLEYEKNKGHCDNSGDCETGTIYKNNKIIFKAYTAPKTLRTVKYYFTFHEATEYFSGIQSGIVDKTKQNNLYTSLSKDQYINSKILQNHVYPVSLNAVNDDNYKIEFKLTDGTGYLNTFEELTTSKKFTGNYTCQYEITNDALTLKNEAIKDYKDLKSNTIFRSVATDDLDPNDRALQGNLGENWINKKGSAVRARIELKETHDGKTNDTYNPGNLEYSFTLTPSIIKAVKEYNNESYRTYNDFNLTCATEDNRECTSEFLTDLVEGKVNGTEVLPNYSSINDWNYNDLENIREKWKYFTGTDIEILEQTTKTDITGHILPTQQAMSLVEYQHLYEKWGILP